MNREIPIACYLTDSELQQRRKDYLDKLAELLTDSEELKNGFNYRLSA